MSLFDRFKTYSQNEQYSQKRINEALENNFVHFVNIVHRGETLKNDYSPPLPPPLKCKNCLYLGRVKNSCYWIGACQLTGQKRSHRNECNQGLLSHFEAVGVLQ